MNDELPVLADSDSNLIANNCNDSNSESEVSNDTRNRKRTSVRNAHIRHMKKHTLWFVIVMTG
jgi:hypothetical protein